MRARSPPRRRGAARSLSWNVTRDRIRCRAPCTSTTRPLASSRLAASVDLPALSEPATTYEWRNADGVPCCASRSARASGLARREHVQPARSRGRLFGRLGATPEISLLRGHAASTQDDDAVALGRHRVAPRDPSPRRGGLVVGCDGANSTVRDLLGPTFEDHGFFYDWLIVDVDLREPRVFDPANLQVCDPARPTTVVSGGPGRRRWEFMCLPGESLDALDEESRAWELLEPWEVTPDNADMVRHAGYRFQARWAKRWHDGRVFLAGDAAHLTPPFAGQGMCAGLRDSVNLAWKLDHVLAHAEPWPSSTATTRNAFRTRPT